MVTPPAAIFDSRAHREWREGLIAIAESNSASRRRGRREVHGVNFCA